ncbi:hypothetical protein [Flammeovirga sp. OC4]|uniref:hypothetical protein n=1 Tax=Flammeovirga sp. OC4 TaxID=1382345 RepID=UPI0005C49194|nr:hypothetical protein [Flammeovirga sp. OC4]
MRKYILLLLFCIIHSGVYSQIRPAENIYYIRLEPNEIISYYEPVMDSILVNYIERYRLGNEKINVDFFTTMNEKVGSDSINLSEGENNIKLFLKKYDFLERGNNYRLKIKEKYGQICTLNFIYASLPLPLDPTTSLEEISLDCEENQKSFFKLETDVKGGVPPYEITYIISEDIEQENLLFEPYHKKNRTKFKDIDLLVDAQKGFYIKAIVIDNCMEVHEEMLFTNCTETTKVKINVNLNPLNGLPTNKTLQQQD